MIVTTNLLAVADKFLFSVAVAFVTVGANKFILDKGIEIEGPVVVLEEKVLRIDEKLLKMDEKLDNIEDRSHRLRGVLCKEVVGMVLHYTLYLQTSCPRWLPQFCNEDNIDTNQKTSTLSNALLTAIIELPQTAGFSSLPALTTYNSQFR